MRILLVKMSSMGDVIHALPAVTDAAKAYPDIRFDWVVEEGFAQIPSWHQQVNEVFPIALRRWRQQGYFKLCQHPEWKALKKKLAKQPYDRIIDAQGLLKSAYVSCFGHGQRDGLSFSSAREPLSSLFYHHRLFVAKDQHAVNRIRQLMAQSLEYTLADKALDYGINPDAFGKKINKKQEPYVLFFHGTSRADKCWPESHWVSLAQKIVQTGLKVRLPWGSEEERARAMRIAGQCDGVSVLPKLSLGDIAGELLGARLAVTMDTGLGHLAAALSVPTVALYGPTDPVLIGTYGENQVHLTTPNRSADLATLLPEQVWEAINHQL